MKICIFCGANGSLDPEVDLQVKLLMDHFALNQVELVYGGAGIGIMGSLATELMVKGGTVTGVIPQQLMIYPSLHFHMRGSLRIGKKSAKLL